MPFGLAVVGSLAWSLGYKEREEEMKLKSFILIFITIILIYSCSEINNLIKSSDDSSNSKGLYGKVMSNSGEIIKNAKIYIEFLLSSEVSLEKNVNCETNFDINPNPSLPGEYILFSIVPNPVDTMAFIFFKYGFPNSVHALLWIENIMLKDTLSVLVDEIKSAGYYTIKFDFSKEPNGLYNAIFAVKTSSEDSSLLNITYIDTSTRLVSHDFESFGFDNIIPNAISDENGEYNIPINNLPFGCEIIKLDNRGNYLGSSYLSHYIKIWVTHENYETTFIDSVFIENEKGKEVNIEMCTLHLHGI